MSQRQTCRWSPLKKSRRPEGLSRRKKKQFGFETLEPRQVMSASALVDPLAAVADPPATRGTISTATAEGQLEALARELWWLSQMSSATGDMSGYVTNSVPTDPLFLKQWHLLNTGQIVGNPDNQPIRGVAGEDLNVLGAWNLGYTGEGVTVAVIDSGTQLNHPDLRDNINPALSFDALNPSGNGNPFFFDPGNAHGTAVAGLIAALANNNKGGTGVAPDAEIAAIRLIDSGQFEQAFVDAFRHSIYTGIDITNNSWGFPVPRALAGVSPQVYLALRDSIMFGRDGKGVIHVFSSGNDGGPIFSTGFQSLGGYDSASYNGYTNSRYTIGVTGVDHDGFYNNVDGTITVYPEIGANILVAAPTGSNAGPVITNDTGLGSGLITTDLTGEFGYNAAPDNDGHEVNDYAYPFDRDFLADTDYTSRMNGTSASAPLVSGVIALMLDANPELTWRDVQEILVRAARQNAPLGVPSSGQTNEPLTQNTWIVNQLPIFHDPDLWNPSIPVDPFLRTMNPVVDPNQSVVGNGSAPFGQNPDHYVATPFTMTNGAGYTVSQGTGVYGEQVGYAHGVVDAEMAVRLAEQWHTKGQALPPELTFTSYVQGQTPELPQARYVIPASEKSSEATGYQIVPGGIGGRAGFIAYWQEFFAAAPDFTQDFEYRGDSSLEFNVPDNQNMRVETVEVKVSINGGTAEALDHLRILLVSPDGTHSELNNFWLEDVRPSTFQLDFSNPNMFTADAPLSRATVYGEPGSTDLAGGGNMVWSFLSNRNWGERSGDAIVFDPVTGEPAIDQLGLYNGPDAIAGQALTQGWRVVIENYGSTPFRLDGIEMAFHGSPVSAASQRVQGFIGIDDNQDDIFNYSRVVQVINNIDNDPTTIRLGEIQNTVDQEQESFAGNVTVVARRASDNSIAARFVTGHDGNFYFDLAPDDYIISIEDPEGRVAQQDTVTPAGTLRKFQSEWHITEDWFKVWDKVSGSPNDVVVDLNGQPIPWLDANGDEQAYGMRGINFLLDPGALASDQVSFSGTVYADVNGVNVTLAGITVFVDANQNGAFDAGETSTITDANGDYTVVQMGVDNPAVMNVGVVKPAQWTTANPLYNLLVSPGDVYANLDFFLDPPADNAGGGGANQPGFLIGTVFEDLDADGVRDGNETGAQDVTVYLDANNNGAKDGGETETKTNSLGAYQFSSVAPGQHVVRILVAASVTQTTPFNGQPYVVTLTGSSTISSLHFGIYDAAVNDFGDVPVSYEARPLAGGGSVLDPARHKKSKYWLGVVVDGELANSPGISATGDDLIGDDEDGIVFDPIIAGGTLRITATANTYTGYLQGWIDWNDDGDFLDADERVLTDQLLIAGGNALFVNVPSTITGTEKYARFRFGEHSHDPVTGAARAIDTPFGYALTGEVEDYRVAVAVAGSPLVVGIPADFDQDEDVDGADFLTWQRNLGRTTGATQSQGSADGDGDVDAADLSQWKADYATIAVAASSAGGAEASAAVAAFASVGLNGGGASLRLAPAFPVYVSSLSSATADATAVEAAARSGAAKLAGRWAEVADRLRHAGDRAEARFRAIGEDIQANIGEVDAVERDWAFDELFSLRRRAAVSLETVAAADEGFDEAFAAIAERFDRRRD